MANVTYDIGTLSNVQKSTKSYQEETGLKLNATSLLRLFPIMEDVSATNPQDGSIYTEKFLNIWRNYDVAASVLQEKLTHSLYDQNFNDHWDNISQKFYNTVYLKWAICLTNEIVNPFEALHSNDQMKILNSGYVYYLMNDIDNISRS